MKSRVLVYGLSLLVLVDLYSAGLGDYEVPVPRQWLVQTLTPTSLYMINVGPNVFPRDGKFHTAGVIDLTLPLLQQRLASNVMENWLSLQRRNLEHYGSRIAEKNLSVGDENIVCIGGDVLRAMMRDEKKFPDSDIVSPQCRSDKALGITFIGEPSDVPDFYALVSDIRKIE